MDDAAAVQACQVGNIDAFRHFVDRYQTRALAHARLLTRNDADAADAVQEAYVDAFRNLSSFDPSRPIRGAGAIPLSGRVPRRDRALKQRLRSST